VVTRNFAEVVASTGQRRHDFREVADLSAWPASGRYKIVDHGGGRYRDLRDLHTMAAFWLRSRDFTAMVCESR
jgi:hypothetical protein